MIGILILTHGEMGKSLLSSVELIIGVQDNVKALGFYHGESIEDFRKNVFSSLKELNHGKGVLILSDLYGGSPANVAMMNMTDSDIQCVTGVNLPMLIEALISREKKDLSVLTEYIIKTGIESIKNLRVEFNKQE